MYLMIKFGTVYHQRIRQIIATLIRAYDNDGNNNYELEENGGIAKGIFMIATFTGMFCKKCGCIRHQLHEEFHKVDCEVAQNALWQQNRKHGVHEHTPGTLECTVCGMEFVKANTSPEWILKNHIQPTHGNLICSLIDVEKTILRPQDFALTVDQTTQQPDWLRLAQMLRTVVKEHGVPRDRVVERPWISHTFVDRLSYLHNWKKNVFKWPGKPEYTALVNIRKILCVKGIGAGTAVGVYDPDTVVKMKKNTSQKKSDDGLSPTDSGTSTPRKKEKNPLDQVTLGSFIEYKNKLVLATNPRQQAHAQQAQPAPETPAQSQLKALGLDTSYLKYMPTK